MEFYKIVCAYLRACKISTSKSFFRRRMQSHPDYPSLISFTDTLDEIGLAYVAAIADKQKYKELQYPLLAHLSDEGKEDFVLISSFGQFEENNNLILDKWHGIVVMIKPGLQISYAEHINCLLKEKKDRKHLLFVSISLSIILTIGGLYYFTITGSSLILLSLCGIAICSLITLYSMGNDSPIMDQLCSADGNSGCDKIIHSKKFELWKGIGFGDAGLVYFTGIALFLTLSGMLNDNRNAFTLLIIPFSCSLFFTVFSLWYQWRVAKSWCRMCLIVIVVIWLQSGMLFANQLLYFKPAISQGSFTLFFVALFLSSIAWFTIKPFILKFQQSFVNELALLKWKRNPEIFLGFLFRQRKINVLRWENDIVLGNAEAKLQIIVACNPYCRPCATTHKQFEQLLQMYPGAIGITVRFAVNELDTKDKKTIAVMSLLQACLKTKTNESKSAQYLPLDDWFSNMNIKVFKEKYPDQASDDCISLLYKHAAWAREVNIIHTPTVFINGYEMGAMYQVPDLFLLTHQIIENITPPATVANEVMEV